jgi:hypothetical protein
VGSTGVGSGLQAASEMAIKHAAAIISAERPVDIAVRSGVALECF